MGNIGFVMYNDMTARWELLIFETAGEYVERKKKEKEKLCIKAEKHKRKIEKIGICEGCGFREENLRWIRNDEIYICYSCFIHDLEIEASLMVPMRRFDEMEEYMSEWEWVGEETPNW